MSKLWLARYKLDKRRAKIWILGLKNFFWSISLFCLYQLYPASSPAQTGLQEYYESLLLRAQGRNPALNVSGHIWITIMMANPNLKSSASPLTQARLWALFTFKLKFKSQFLQIWSIISPICIVSCKL